MARSILARIRARYSNRAHIKKCRNGSNEKEITAIEIIVARRERTQKVASKRNTWQSLICLSLMYRIMPLNKIHDVVRINDTVCSKDG